jgi:hypothetical protein
VALKEFPGAFLFEEFIFWTKNVCGTWARVISLKKIEIRFPCLKIYEKRCRHSQ